MSDQSPNEMAPIADAAPASSWKYWVYIIGLILAFTAGGLVFAATVLLANWLWGLLARQGRAAQVVVVALVVIGGFSSALVMDFTVKRILGFGASTSSPPPTEQFPSITQTLLSPSIAPVGGGRQQSTTSTREQLWNAALEEWSARNREFLADPERSAALQLAINEVDRLTNSQLNDAALIERAGHEAKLSTGWLTEIPTTPDGKPLPGWKP
jgi:hypothetical protein